MPRDRQKSIERYRYWYSILLRLYSKTFYQRFGESMEQTFNDLLRERAIEKRPLFSFTAWLFAETSAGIIKEHLMMRIKQDKGAMAIGLTATLVSLAVMVAMQFTDEVKWGPGDFVMAWILIIGAGLAFKWFVNKKGSFAYRAAAGIAVGAGLLLIWSNLAVGIIGHEGNPANLLYLGVLAVGIIGVAKAQFQAQEMAHALFATALAQTLVAVIALTAGLHRHSGTSVTEMVHINGVFVVLFVISGLLFRYGAEVGGRTLKPN